MKNLKILISISAVLIFISCENKEKENLNQLPEAPVLLSPENGTVTGTDSVFFKWEKSYDSEGDKSIYNLYAGTDSNKLKYVDRVFDKMELVVTDFEKGKKYYWRLKVENYFDGNVPDLEEGEVWSDIRYFYTTPPGVSNLRDTSGYSYVTLFWNDPADLDYVEISFEPTVASITQPIKISAGTEKLELTNMENGTLYTFNVVVYNKLGHMSEPDTIKSLPLIPIQVHDIDFNIYNAVTIGTQTWLRENLRATRFQDGSALVYGDGDQIPLSYFTGSESDKYGLYYYAIFASGGYSQDKNVCPCGYHVPSDEEWKTLESYMGMTEEDVNSENFMLFRGEKENVGNLLKSTTGWKDYNGTNGNGTDFYSFNLLPAGYKIDDVIGSDSLGIMWTSTCVDGANNKVRVFSNSSSGIRRSQYGANFKASIRCIKD